MQEREDALGRELERVAGSGAGGGCGRGRRVRRGSERGRAAAGAERGGGRRERRLAAIRAAKAALEAEAAPRPRRCGRRTPRSGTGGRGGGAQEAGRVPDSAGGARAGRPAQLHRPRVANHGQCGQAPTSRPTTPRRRWMSRRPDHSRLRRHQPGRRRPHLAPMVARVEAATGGRPGGWSGRRRVFQCRQRGRAGRSGEQALLPPDRQSPRAADPARAGGGILEAAGWARARPWRAATGKSPRHAMRASWARRGRRVYAKRKQTVEPVFGQIKEDGGCAGSCCRGLAKVNGEWGCGA